ncbi:hypothetical protein, partial [Burkholderia pseudomallei]|uniref:hypothetical protein n=1 Tax=Burkholderia pseudomallei TaxID=28450 RepID=UPI001C4D1CC6
MTRTPLAIVGPADDMAMTARTGAAHARRTAWRMPPRRATSQHVRDTPPAAPRGLHAGRAPRSPARVTTAGGAGRGEGGG